jgi:hypothetical protein
MKSTAPHSGFTFAVLTAAGFSALARGTTSNDPEHPPCIVWDWDERTSRGPRRRPVMHLIGLRVSPGDFTPPSVEADFDRDGTAVGVYYPSDWELDAAATILDAIARLPLDQAVLIAIWDGGAGHVSVLGSDEITLDPNSAEPFDGVNWSPATPDAEPRWIREHPSRIGVSIVLVDEHPPVDPGEPLDTSGLHGLRDALEELLYDCPFEVFVRDYADGADFPPGDDLTNVFGVSRRLKRMSEASGRLSEVPGSSERGTAGPYDWYLLRGAFHDVTGHVLRVQQGTLVTDMATAGPYTWELMRRYGITGGFDRVVIADHDYYREREVRPEAFASRLPEDLREHNYNATEAVRSVGARTLDTRLQDLTDVWDSLANWEGPVRDDAPAVEFLRAYTASGSSWPTRQSKSSPMIIWIGAEQGNRPAGYLEGLAAAYHAGRDLLEINADFPAFQALSLYWRDRYARLVDPVRADFTADEINATIDEVVREWCEQTLVEVVVGVNQLAGRPGWDEARVRAALSSEALSGAALAIHHVQQSIKRSLGQRLGSLKEVKTA